MLGARHGLRPIIHLPDLEIRILFPANAMPPAIHIMRERTRADFAEAVELVTQAGGNLRGRLPKVARRVRRRGQGANQIFSTRITVSDMGRDEEVTGVESRGLAAEKGVEDEGRKN